MPIEVRVPDLGSFKDVAVIDLLVKAGDTVEIDTPLVTLETEKATIDVPSSSAGVVEALHVANGSKVNAGDLIVTLRDGTGSATATPPASPASAAPSASTASAAAVASAATTPPLSRAAAAASTDSDSARAGPAGIPGGRSDLAVITEPGFSTAHAGPSVRRLARELGVDLGAVKGAGVKGRISHDDVKAHVKHLLGGGTGGGAGASSALPRVVTVDFAAFGPVEIRPLNRVQRISGPRLHAAWVNLPHVTQFDEADITELEEARVRLKEGATARGIKLTPLAFIIRACARSLVEFPVFRASLDEGGQNLVMKDYCHIGFAADTPNGLLVPVIRDADCKDVYDLARELADLSAKARAGKLSGAEMQGGCFTVSSLGGIGGTAFTPIINAPEVAILGVSRSSMKPQWRGEAFVPRLMLPLSLSYDHRVIDGALGARFTTHLAAQLADVSGLLEAVP